MQRSKHEERNISPIRKKNIVGRVRRKMIVSSLLSFFFSKRGQLPRVARPAGTLEEQRSSIAIL